MRALPIDRRCPRCRSLLVQIHLTSTVGRFKIGGLYEVGSVDIGAGLINGHQCKNSSCPNDGYYVEGEGIA